MEATWLIPLLFLAPLALVVIVTTARSAFHSLDDLPLEAEERVLFDDADAKVRMRSLGWRGLTVYPQAIVRLTTHRLIVAQRAAFGSKRPVRATFRRAGAPEPNIAKRIPGYGVYRVAKASSEESDRRATIQATPELGAQVTYDVELEVTSPRFRDYASLATPAA